MQILFLDFCFFLLVYFACVFELFSDFSFSFFRIFLLFSNVCFFFFKIVFILLL